jgi:hypothetical protein
MHKSTFHQKPLARGIALALGLSTLSPGFAQTADEQPAELEEIVVTGIRASLEASMDLKRNSFGVVDAITAEDMGNFPDTNLAESLQRSPACPSTAAWRCARAFAASAGLQPRDAERPPDADPQVSQWHELGRSSSHLQPPEGISSVEVFKSAGPTCRLAASVRRSTSTRRVRWTRQFRRRRPPAACTTFAHNLNGTNVTPELSGLI